MQMIDTEIELYYNREKSLSIFIDKWDYSHVYFSYIYVTSYKYSQFP